jgi:hypothetical protein
MNSYVRRLLDRLEGVQSSEVLQPRTTFYRVADEQVIEAFDSTPQTESISTASLEAKAESVLQTPVQSAPQPVIQRKPKAGRIQTVQSHSDAVTETTDKPGTIRLPVTVNDATPLAAIGQPVSGSDVSLNQSRSITSQLSQVGIEPVQAGTKSSGITFDDTSVSGQDETSDTGVRLKTISQSLKPRYADRPINLSRPEERLQPVDVGVDLDSKDVPAPVTKSSTILPKRYPDNVMLAPPSPGIIHSILEPHGKSTRVHIGNIHVHLAEEVKTPQAKPLQVRHSMVQAPVSRTSAIKHGTGHYGLGQL